jgi:predicted membrane protein
MNESNNNYEAWREERRRQWEERRAQRMGRYSHGGVYAGHSRSHSHAVWGIIVLLVGMLFLLQNLGYFYIGDFFRLWPVILVALGIARILDSRSLGSLLWGGTLAVAGAVLLANNLGFIPWDLWHIFWPVLLICWGAAILARGFLGRGQWIRPHSFVDDTSTISDNVLKEAVVFGGIHRKIDSQDFLGGEARAIFGGIDIDLRGASTTKDVIEIEADAIFGGVELKVPDTWEVIVRGAGVLGGYDDKTRPAPAVEGVKRPKLIIRGEAVFGGVTVRN